MKPLSVREFSVLTIWMWREYGIEITKVPEFIIVRDVREERVQP